MEIANRPDPAWNPLDPLTGWRKCELALLSKLPDAEVADLTARSPQPQTGFYKSAQRLRRFAFLRRYPGKSFGKIPRP